MINQMTTAEMMFGMIAHTVNQSKLDGLIRRFASKNRDSIQALIDTYPDKVDVLSSFIRQQTSGRGMKKYTCLDVYSDHTSMMEFKYLMDFLERIYNNPFIGLLEFKHLMNWAQHPQKYAFEFVEEYTYGVTLRVKLNEMTRNRKLTDPKERAWTDYEVGGGASVYLLEKPFGKWVGSVVEDSWEYHIYEAPLLAGVGYGVQYEGEKKTVFFSYHRFDHLIEDNSLEKSKAYLNNFLGVNKS